MTLFLSLALAGGVAVVKSDSLTAYDAPATAVVAGLGGHTTVEVHDIKGDRDTAEDVMKELRRDKPDVVVALGPKAAWSVREALPDTPLVYVMVSDPARYGIEGPLVTGVSENVPPDALMAQVHLFAPEVQRIGMVLHSDNQDARVAESIAAAERAGFELKVLRVTRERDVKGALLRLRDTVDAVWMVPDAVVVTPENFRFLREESRRIGMPVIASSEVLVQAGALMCVAPDYAVVGEQAAQLTLSILGGTSPSELPVLHPTAVRVVLNRETMEAIELDIDPMLLDFVDEVVGSEPGARTGR
mgnify:CR=1 FL=1